MNRYFCVLPYYSVEKEFTNPGKNIYCCRLPRNVDIKQVRKSIEKQERSPHCGACWELEDSGLTSERQIHNNTLDSLLDLNIENIELRTQKFGPEHLQIKLATSNLCNGTCVTCNSTLSSAWASLEGRNSQYRSMDFDTNWAAIKSLSFVGGEPFLERKNFKILEALIETGNTDCFVSVVTNGSITLTESNIQLLKKFSNLNICVSIDGIGNVFEYMRYPLKWAQLQENLRLFRELTNNISVSCMISNLNILYYTELIDFFKEQKLNYVCKHIIHPIIFAPSNLPNKIRDQIQIRNFKYYKEVNSFMTTKPFNSMLFDRFKQELSRQDALKKISVETYLPDFYKYLE